jgi:hypothetical protein
LSQHRLVKKSTVHDPFINHSIVIDAFEGSEDERSNYLNLSANGARVQAHSA